MSINLFDAGIEVGMKAAGARALAAKDMSARLYSAVSAAVRCDILCSALCGHLGHSGDYEGIDKDARKLARVCEKVAKELRAEGYKVKRVDTFLDISWE